jgi:integrase
MVSKRPAILTPAECKTLVETAKEKMPQSLPALALKIFAGVRNEELGLAQWENLQPDTRRVWKTKTGRPRSITVDPALIRWLPTERPTSGPIFSTHPEIVKDRALAWILDLRELQRLSGVKIHQNALRHSFGTYHRQRGKDTARTAFEMGNSPAVVERNYADSVPDSAANAFWAL